MEKKLNSRVGLYPGCSLEGSSLMFDTSLKAVLRALDVPIKTLKDWNCCGATSAHALDTGLHLALTTRNLALAESQGFDEVLAPCAACYHRLASTEHELKEDAALREKINKEAGLTYQGRARVRNVLDYLVNVIGLDRIRKAVTHPLSGLRVVSYYGCLNTRVPRMACFDDQDHPMAMDRIVEALGGEIVDWAYKTECCGASLFLTAESVSARLVSKILKDAVARGADCLAVSCPMCQNNLDTKQDEVRQTYGVSRPMPVVFITQLMGLAFGLSEKVLGFKKSFVPLSLSSIEM